MKTVFTNGVFDIIHDGHIRLLKWARSYGDKLIVAINSDESAKRLKGLTRPIFSERQREAILLELRCVDEVIIFAEDTPERLIQELEPDVLVKGPEARRNNIPGACFIMNNGGEVITPDWIIEESTSLIVQRVLQCDRPLMRSGNIKINGTSQEDLQRYSFMFNKQPDGYRPVLYRDGRRIIHEWELNIQHYQPADKEGCSG